MALYQLFINGSHPIILAFLGRRVLLAKMSCLYVPPLKDLRLSLKLHLGICLDSLLVGNVVEHKRKINGRLVRLLVLCVGGQAICFKACNKSKDMIMVTTDGEIASKTTTTFRCTFSKPLYIGVRQREIHEKECRRRPVKGQLKLPHDEIRTADY